MIVRMTRAVILSPMGPPAELIPPLTISFSSLFGLFWAIFGARGGKNVDTVENPAWRRGPLSWDVRAAGSTNLPTQIVPSARMPTKGDSDLSHTCTFCAYSAWGTEPTVGERRSLGGPSWQKTVPGSGGLGATRGAAGRQRAGTPWA